MSTHTKGGELLRAWLKEERRTQEWLAEQLGTHQTTVSGWLLGREISLKFAVAIHKLTKIPVSTWTLPADESAA